MFESCKTAKETKEELIKIVKSSDLVDVQNHIAKEFYNVNSVVEFIYNSILAGGNAILYGPGGFGKSEITKAFFKYYGITPLVIVGNSGTDIEALLGIPNIKKLTEESVYEIAFEKSIFNKAGVLIFEEFLDVKPMVAAALKDIITEGGYRRGDEFIHSKVGAMFICSNKSPDEVTIDFSTAAFYKERFPYSKYVIWNNYSRNSYLELFKLRYSDIFETEQKSLKLIAELCSGSCDSSNVISPRIAFSAVNLFMLNKDIRSLEMISMINMSKLDEIQTRLRLEHEHEKLNHRFLSINDHISKFEFSSIEDIAAFVVFEDKFTCDVKRFNFEGDELIKTISNLINNIALKRLEADERLLVLGKQLPSKLSAINRVYENIQKYIS